MKKVFFSLTMLHTVTVNGKKALKFLSTEKIQ